MKVICVFPMFPIQKHHANMPIIIEECEKNIFPELCKLGAISPEIRFSNINYTYLKTNQVLEGEPKGKGVLECLKNCSKVDYIILCDGSSAIHYKYIIDVFQELTSDPNMCCVMANRVKGKAINNFRYLIERFEVFILKSFFNHQEEILDGQCGLWGYKAGKLEVNSNEKEIKLTSNGYELELDLLAEVLRNDLQYSFINIELPDRKVHSSFDYKNNLLKIKFFLGKYSNLKDCIPKYIEEFENTDEFTEHINNRGVKKEEWERYKQDILKLI